jgi:hypothetical protein
VVGTSGSKKDIRKGHGRAHMWKYYVDMYVNGKMRLVEMIPGMGGGEMKNND